MIKILIADDHALVREGVKQIAALAEDIVVASEAVNGWDALEKLQKIPCHVLLLDISMPGINGIELIKRVREIRPLLPILILSMYSEGHLAARALKAGASGYVTKDSEPETLIGAIHKVASGGRYVEPRLAEQMALEFSLSDDRPPHETLSEREFQVLEKVLAGKHINEIALDMSLSAKTVSTHKARLMRKLNIQNNAELVRYGLKHGLFEAGEASARDM